MNCKKSKLTGLLMTVGLMAMATAAACAGGDPEELSIPVSINAGEMDPSTIEVKQGDMVTLNIQTDESGEFHLHTYDIEAEIEAETETDFYFVAEATGRFKITYHPQGEHGVEGHGGGHGGGQGEGHGTLFESEELDAGDTFSYEIKSHQAGETVPFHSHLRPALHGKIIVSQEAGMTEAVAIEYRDDAAVPNEVHVGPGTVITWTNSSSNHQTVISGLHANMSMDSGTDKTEHDDDEVEIEIGFLEVQPR